LDATVTREWPDLFETAERDREITAIGEQLVRLESETSKLEARLDRLISGQEARMARRPIKGAAESRSGKNSSHRAIASGDVRVRGKAEIPRTYLKRRS
jgi:hypothetical protein